MEDKAPIPRQYRASLDDAERAFYTEIIDVAPIYPFMTLMPDYVPERKARFFILQCTDCGDVHTGSCPRVASKTFHENGQLASVTYHAKWDRSGSVHLEDVFNEPEVVGKT